MYFRWGLSHSCVLWVLIILYYSRWEPLKPCSKSETSGGGFRTNDNAKLHPRRCMTSTKTEMVFVNLGPQQVSELWLWWIIDEDKQEAKRSISMKPKKRTVWTSSIFTTILKICHSFPVGLVKTTPAWGDWTPKSQTLADDC